jgi:hypothetical protein
VPLFRGRIRDYKRRNAECVGIVKCKIKIFRKEDETIAGKAKADNSRDPEFYEVSQHTSAYVGIRQHTSARQTTHTRARFLRGFIPDAMRAALRKRQLY